jgi:serine phosphatase RsbU (regulator of sigma subunit)
LAVGVVAMVLQVVSFPVVSSHGGLLGTGAQSSAALYLLFHLSFAAGVAAGARGYQTRWRGPILLVGWAVAVLLAVDAIPLPVLIESTTRFTPLLVVVEVVLAALTAMATAVWVLRVGRTADTLHGWVGVALSLSVFDLLLNALGAERFTSVWWASLSLRVATYLVLAFGALTAVLGRLRDAESYSESELERRESQLRSSLLITAGLLSSAEDLSRAVTSEQVADVLSSNARRVSGSPYASVLVGRMNEPLGLLGADGYTEEMRQALEQVGWDLMLPAPQVFARGEPVFVESRNELLRQFPHVTTLPMGEAGSLAVLPIKVRGESMGVLSVWDVVPRAWSRNQRRVLAGLAAQGGQAIARAQAYEEQAAAARTLQTSLLPTRLPTPARLELAARYVPAVDGVLVGGDWYDCLVLDDGLVALVVGDVMGKGLHAAAQMGQIRMAVRTLAASDPEPVAVLRALDGLNIELGIDEIVTMVYVLVDTGRGVARIGRAGHLPPALARRDGRVELVDAGGSPPLGTPGAERVDAEFRIPPGALLVLYTDGLVEDRVTGLDDGLDQLRRSLVGWAQARRPVGEVAAHLLEECGSVRGTDDIALLVARYQ